MQLSEAKQPTIWDIQYCSPPAVLRYCKKCGRKSEYVSSEEFRVNAQQKSLDIWLIYKCRHCNSTWNNTIYSRVSPQQLGTDLLERFSCNDKVMAMQCATNYSLLLRNGAEVKEPTYQIVGDDVSLEQTATIKIRNQYKWPLRLSSILREKLDLSQREFDTLLSNNRIRGDAGQNLKKCKLQSSEALITIKE